MNLSDSDSTDSILKAVLGFFGVIAAMKVVPKLFSFITRTFVLGFVSKLIFITTAGLLTKKGAETFTGRDS